MRTALAALAILAAASQSAHAADYYGAIAVSPTTSALGWSYDYGSRNAAERAALGKCEEHADDCQVAVWFRNACGAVAIGDGGWGGAWATNKDAAISRAIDACSNHAENCEWKRWQCTTR